MIDFISLFVGIIIGFIIGYGGRVITKSALEHGADKT